MRCFRPGLDMSNQSISVSVMIPTYNCAEYLKQTLESVLCQCAESEIVQITVVDDCSTRDDPESVVRSFGSERITFQRNPKNLGVAGNFNECLKHARGDWVHILHGDDYILPGFYKTVLNAIRSYPDIGIIATRVFYVDEKSDIESMSPRLKSLETPSRNPKELAYSNNFQFAGVVLSMRVVEKTGGFSVDFRHCTDWEMWTRAIIHSGGLSINKPLGCYRLFEGNDTSKLKRSGDNIVEMYNMHKCLAVRVPDFDAERFRRMIATAAARQANMFMHKGDMEASRCNYILWKQFSTLAERLALSVSRRLACWFSIV